MTINPIDVADGTLGLIETWQKWCIDNQCDVNPFCTQAKKKLAELIDAKCATPECSEFEEWKNENLFVKDGEVKTHTVKWNKAWPCQVGIDTFEKCWQAAQASKKIKVPSEKQLNKHSGMWAIAKQRDSAIEDFEMGALWMLENICYINQLCTELERLNGCKVDV